MQSKKKPCPFYRVPREKGRIHDFDLAETCSCTQNPPSENTEYLCTPRIVPMQNNNVYKPHLERRAVASFPPLFHSIFII